MSMGRQEEDAWLRARHRADINAEAQQDGCLGTSLAFILLVAGFEVANVLVGSQFEIPRNWILPVLGGLSCIEIPASIGLAVLIGRHIEEERSFP